MAQSCECYKKVKYLENLCNLDDAEEVEGKELGDSIYSIAQRENTVKLPGVIKVNDAVPEYPDTQNTALPILFQQLTEIISGVDDYESNILSFWIIDLFLEGLRTAQVAGMNHRNQKATLHWMVFVYNTIQGSGTKLRRKDITLKLKLLLLITDDDEFSSTSELHDPESETKTANSSQQTSKGWRVPFPPVWRSGSDDSESAAQLEASRVQIDHESSGETSIRTEDDLNADNTENNVHFMEIILEILYRIYARLWPFLLLQTALLSTPTLEVVDLPFKLNLPKQVLKLDSSVQTKSDKGGRKTVSQRTSDETAAGKDLAKGDYILPLQVAEGADNFLRDLFALPSHEPSIVDRGKLDKKKK